MKYPKDGFLGLVRSVGVCLSVVRRVMLPSHTDRLRKKESGILLTKNWSRA